MWYYQNEEVDSIDPKFVAFVYVIENLTNGRKYIGKKRLQFSKTKQVKGVKKKYKIESDWRTYTGSSEELNEDIKKFGIENFKKEIIHLCTTLGESGYLEAKEQFVQGALESDAWYNTWIMVRVRKSHLPKNLKKTT